MRLSVLQADGSVGGALTELRSLQVWSSSQRFVAQLGKRELVRLVIVDRSGDLYIHGSIVSAKRHAQVAHGDLVIPFRVGDVRIKLKLLNFQPLQIQSRNLPS